MTIRKPVQKSVPDVSVDDIDRIINAGSPPPAGAEEDTRKEVKFQMVIPADLCQLIDGDRRLTKTSRRTWLLHAAREKLERDGKL